MADGIYSEDIAFHIFFKNHLYYPISYTGESLLVNRATNLQIVGDHIYLIRIIYTYSETDCYLLILSLHT